MSLNACIILYPNRRELLSFEEISLKRDVAQDNFEVYLMFWFFRHFSCLPATSGIKEISVCLTPAGSESGMMAPQCAIARVEEHYR